MAQGSKLITRDDIIECGKRKELIAEEDDLTKLPPEKIAKAGAAKVYETLAEAMKAKAVKYKDLRDKAIAQQQSSQKPKEEEAKGKGGKVQPPPKPTGKKEDTQQINVQVQYPEDDVDLYVFFKDFPKNENEAIAFSQERYALNAVINIKEEIVLAAPKVEIKKDGEEEGKEEPIPGILFMSYE